MKFLLPNRYKRIGAVIAPLGFTLWLLMQRGYVTKALTLIWGAPPADFTGSPYHVVNVMVAIFSFFSFLGGVYFLTFSKEAIEDEMVQRTRLDSFQFAALVQIIFTIAGFFFMVLVEEPGKEGMLLFFAGLILLFWLSFISRFNYILHVKLR